MADLRGKRVLVTAGPTYEAIDPVRFIGNRSSGKMGAAIAEAAADQGAEVWLVMGPSQVRVSDKVRRMDVESAQEMLEACLSRFAEADIAVMSAAVADYRPDQVASQKIKKSGSGMTITLVPTPDILASLGRMKRPGQVLVGFALETENGLENATAKLHRKHCDLMVLNTLADEGAGFGHDTNRITLLSSTGGVRNFALKPKAEVAVDILEAIKELL